MINGNGKNVRPYLTFHQVGALLGVHPQTVRAWVRRGILPAVRIGRTVRIRREDLERALRPVAPEAE